MSEKQVSGQFREAFKGYHKDDVNAYIQQMFHQFEERERALLRQRREQPAPTPAVSPARVDELMAEIAKRDAEIEALNAKIAESQELAARYQMMSAQFGDIMLRAAGDADRLIEQAKATAQEIEQQNKARAEVLLVQAESRAAEIRADADAYAAAIRAEALKQADTIIAYASDRMKHLYHDETEGYAKVLDTLKHQTVHFAEKLSQYRESFPSEVSDAQDIAKEAVRQIATDLSGTPHV